jgi:hypothetical protein
MATIRWRLDMDNFTMGSYSREQIARHNSGKPGAWETTLGEIFGETALVSYSNNFCDKLFWALCRGAAL